MENGTDDKEIEGLLKKSNRKFIERDLIEFLKIPSNTLNKKGIQDAMEFIISYISPFTQKVDEIEGKINPLIFAEVEGQLKSSLLIYMMYDTQPVHDDTKWFSGPFSAEIRILPKPLDMLGKCIVSRGAYNSKTPLLSFLNVIKILKESKKLPISLLLLFDGEEEVGSPTLLKFLKNQKDLFKKCGNAYYPAAKLDLEGKAVLKLGYKGILSLNIKLFSENEETHSAYSSIIPNPAVELICLLNHIYSENKFNIPSLKRTYKLNNQEEIIIDTLSNKIDINKIKMKAGITQTFEENAKEAFIDFLFNPTFNISTLKSGYLGEGIKNIVPISAECNIDIRFSHDISVGEIYKEIKSLIEKFAEKSKLQVKLTKNICYEGSRVSINSKLTTSLLKSFQTLKVKAEIWPLSAASAPLSQIQKDLGLDFIVGGLGLGGYAHSPNEFIQVDSILNMRLSNYYFLKYYSKDNSKLLKTN
ncbi:MAG: M20/M25/M40 family metallo-hydrolase [Promethearchaeota archaeon]